MALLAGIYAAPFLSLWVGPRFAPTPRLLQLFLVATLPLVLSVLVQMAIGMGQIQVVACSALVGALVNLPLSYYLTRRLGVPGVIWGTVLTTLFSNLLVPGIYVFRVLDIRLATFFRRTLGAPLTGAVALVAATWACRSVFSADARAARVAPPAPRGPLLVNLTVGAWRTWPATCSPRPAGATSPRSPASCSAGAGRGRRRIGRPRAGAAPRASSPVRSPRAGLHCPRAAVRGREVDPRARCGPMASNARVIRATARRPGIGSTPCPAPARRPPRCPRASRAAAWS